ncbi:MAG TPA: hypothetical protein VJB98_01255 [Candidatus Paceibacterota bacterium]
MSAWGTRRQLSFVFIFVLLLAVAIVVLLIANRHVPSCSDDLANQGEIGIDCGGPCTKVCSDEASELVVLWTRVFKVRDGAYDIAAFVENPNTFGLTDLTYKIRVYDAENIPVKDVEGSTYLNPHARTLILVPQVDVGFRIPTRAFITFPDNLDWKRLQDTGPEPLLLTNQRIETEPVLSLRTTVTNDSLRSIEDIELSAFLYGESGNVVHVSRTYLEELPSGASKDVVLTWPFPPLERIVSADILPRFDQVLPNIITTEKVGDQQ